METTTREAVNDIRLRRIADTLGMLFSHGGQTRAKTALIVNTKASDGIQIKNMS
jgi:hypothetical protein